MNARRQRAFVKVQLQPQRVRLQPQLVQVSVLGKGSVRTLVYGTCTMRHVQRVVNVSSM